MAHVMLVLGRPLASWCALEAVRMQIGVAVVPRFGFLRAGGDDMLLARRQSLGYQPCFFGLGSCSPVHGVPALQGQRQQDQTRRRWAARALSVFVGSSFRKSTVGGKLQGSARITFCLPEVQKRGGIFPYPWLAPSCCGLVAGGHWSVCCQFLSQNVGLHAGVNRVRRDMGERPGTRQWARDVRNHTPPTTTMLILGSDRHQSRHGSVLRQCEAITPDLSTLSSRRASTQRVVSGDGNVQAAPDTCCPTIPTRLPNVIARIRIVSDNGCRSRQLFKWWWRIPAAATQAKVPSWKVKQPIAVSDPKSTYLASKYYSHGTWDF